MTDRERLLVELVDGAGDPIGTGTVAQAHTPPGRLHRAFSVMLYDESGRTLLQRRAAAKTRFASRWSNACCGHPAPGQDLAAAAAGRLTAELGLASTLTEVGVFTYRAADPASGLVEHEWDHVLVGRVRHDTVVAPDPAEVSELAWVAPDRLAAALAADPDGYTPWLPGVLRTAGSRLTE
jgi:isopentenyl-diphosphate delta-isomerase